MHSYLFIWTLLISVLQFSNVFAVSDENICEGPPCAFCCKDKVCRSEEECKGNFQPLIIVGIVAGGLVGLFIVYRLYVYYKSKNPRPQSKGKRQHAKSSRNWRSRGKSPKPEKEAKAKKTKMVKKEVRDKSDVYLQVEDGSVISPDITIKVEAPNDNPTSERKAESNNELKPKSKTEVAATSQNEIKDKEMTASKATENKAAHWTSKKDAPSKDKDKKGKDGKDKDKDRGRSKSGNKDRSGSQKKSSSKGPGDKKSKDMKSSTATKDMKSSTAAKDMKSSMRSSKKN